MTHRYFKFVALSDHDWIVNEFLAGRARFGWSWPGSDLRRLEQKETLTEDERITWRYTQFLIRRLNTGDRLVCQFQQPMREFWIGEVTAAGYEFDGNPRDDFNHIIHVEPLTPQAVSVKASFVPAALRHDLTKRGHYYEIYPEESIACLDRLVATKPWLSAAVDRDRTEADEFDDARARMIRETIRRIQEQWKATAFEVFCDHLCRGIDWIEVHSRQDTKQGWDLLIRILDPITGELLIDEVPVQCKNYDGEVDDDRPIEDLQRAIKNSGASLAYLFIMGTITDSFRTKLERAQDSMSVELDRPITLRLLDQETIAELYLRTLVKTQTTRPSTTLI